MNNSAHAYSQASASNAVSLRAFALRSGLSFSLLKRYCECGRIDGAYFHPLTRHWWLNLPVKIIPASAKP